MKAVFVVLMLFISFSSLHASAATNLREDSYHIREQYITNSSPFRREYVYRLIFEPYNKVLPITGDVLIPIQYKDAGGFILESGRMSSRRRSAAIRLTSYSGSKNLPFVAMSEFKILAGDYNGDGLKDLLVRMSGHDFLGVIIYGSEKDTPEVFEYIRNTGEHATYLSQSAILEVEDIDGDGRDEILVRQNGVVAAVYNLASSTTSRFVDVQMLPMDQRSLVLGERIGSKIQTVNTIAPASLITSVNYAEGELGLSI